MNLDVIVLKYLLNKEHYNNYYRFISKDKYKYSNKFLYKIYCALETAHDSVEKQELSPEDLRVVLHAEYPVHKEDEALYFDKIFENLKNTDVDGALVATLFDQYRKQTLAQELAIKAVDVAQGKGEFTDLQQFLESNAKTVTEIPDDVEEFQTTSLSDILSTEKLEGGLKWPLETLNKIFGRLRKGDFGFVFARPEGGKTTFVLFVVASFLKQCKGNVLWVNNEQRGTAVILRLYSAFFGKTEQQIRANVAFYESEFKKQVGDRFKFLDSPYADRKRIDELCEKLQPEVIVFDQLDKVRGFDAERNDLVLKDKYQWARELAKLYGPVIGICQAGGSAEHKQYLDMNDVADSHTGKQGEADWMLGIGQSKEIGFENVRYIHACKNKLPSDDLCDPLLRHAKTEIMLNAETAEYVDKYF